MAIVDQNALVREVLVDMRDLPFSSSVHHLLTSPTSSRAPIMPEVIPSDDTSDTTTSLIDVDSPHISSVPSDFDSQSIQTDTQRDRIQRESDAAQRRAHAIEQSAKDQARSAKEKAKSAGAKAKEEGKEAARLAKENSDNPVVLGNVGVLVAVAGLLSVGAYRKHVAGELTWKVVGTWAGIVGLLGVGDFYTSRYFFQKYPPKK